MCLLHQPTPSAFPQEYSSYREADQGAAALQAASEGACASQKACEVVEEAAAEAGLIEGDSARLVKVPLAQELAKTPSLPAAPHMYPACAHHLKVQDGSYRLQQVHARVV